MTEINEVKSSSDNAVQKAREAKLFTIDELSTKTGIPKFILKSIEEGNRRPSLQELHELSLALHTNPFDLVEFSQEMNHNTQG